jgi:hypothetical protein
MNSPHPMDRNRPTADWRALLPQLQGLPLLPCNGKAPMDPATGGNMRGWPTAAFTPQQIAALGERITGCGTRTGRDARGLLAFDLDGAAAVTFARERGCDPAAAETWQIVRTTDPARLKVLWRVPADLWPVLGDLRTERKLKPPVKDESGRVIAKGEGIELYFGAGQILLLGLHPESGGQYSWQRSPAGLAEIPPDWWRLAVELADSAPPEQRGQRSRSTTGSGDWQRLQRCPICGRKDRPVCQRHRDGQTLRCFHGVSHSPPGGLRVGELIPGTPWAFCRVQAVGWADFSIFRRHQPRAMTLARRWAVGGGRRG